MSNRVKEGPVDWKHFFSFHGIESPSNMLLGLQAPFTMQSIVEYSLWRLLLLGSLAYR